MPVAAICIDVPAATLGLAGVISIDCRVELEEPIGIAPLRRSPLLPEQPVRARNPNRNAAPLNFDNTNELRDERMRNLPNMSHFSADCGGFHYLSRASLRSHA